jgi:uncharacterized membrane protein (DUF2068 family)
LLPNALPSPQAATQVAAFCLGRPLASPPSRGAGTMAGGFFFARHPAAPPTSFVSPSHHRGLRTVALFEAAKGAIVLIVGFGLLSFLGRDTEVFAEHLVNRLHLNPAHHYPQIFIHAMADVTNTELWIIASFAALYSTVRFVEAYGLWHARRWAEWLAALSGAVYVPVELYELAHHATWLKFGALVVNLAVVAYMARLLIEARRAAPVPAGPRAGD